jgi:hypothetical protein
MNAKTSRNPLSVHGILNNLLIAGPNFVRYSSVMWTSSAATVRRNTGKMISGTVGLFK